jgi:hypothetical protein
MIAVEVLDLAVHPPYSVTLREGLPTLRAGLANRHVLGTEPPSSGPGCHVTSLRLADRVETVTSFDRVGRTNRGRSQTNVAVPKPAAKIVTQESAS